MIIVARRRRYKTLEKADAHQLPHALHVRVIATMISIARVRYSAFNAMPMKEFVVALGVEMVISARMIIVVRATTLHSVKKAVWMDVPWAIRGSLRTQCAVELQASLGTRSVHCRVFSTTLDIIRSKTSALFIQVAFFMSLPVWRISTHTPIQL